MNKIPVRMCCVCRGRFEKPDLVRVVKNKDGEIDSHEAEKIIYKNGNDWITKEEYDKANGIDNMVEEPEPEIDNKQESQPAKKETLFEKIANWFKGLFS